MRGLLFVNFFRSSMTCLFSLVFNVVHAGANTFADGVARILGFLLVRLCRCTADHFLERVNGKCINVPSP